MTFKQDSHEVLIVAAEASSALYARRLLEHWREQGQKITAFGVGDAAMEQLGFERLGKSEQLAVVGLQEVLAHWDIIKTTFHALLEAAERRRPRVVLLLDYPDFNLRLAKKVKKLGLPVVYYISPQLWAWRQGRVKIVKKFIDKVLLLFPFEQQFYQQHGVAAEFVGHPLLDEIARGNFSENDRQILRTRYGIQKDQLVLGLMPGSRRSELNHHLEVQLQTARLLCQKYAQLRVVLLVAPGLSIEELQSRLGSLQFPVIIAKEEPFKMIHMTDIVLCASGTATLMVGLLCKPMLIMYRMHPVTAWMAKRLVKHTRFFGMANLILDRQVVPERFQEQAEPEKLAQELEILVESQSERERVAGELAELALRLGDCGATKRVAAALSEYLPS